MDRCRSRSAAAGSREAADTYLGRLRDLERLLVIEQLSVQERVRLLGRRRRRRRRYAGAAVEIPEVQVQLTMRVFTLAGPVVPTDPAHPDRDVLRSAARPLP